jgi:hypothetical protein
MLGSSATRVAALITACFAASNALSNSGVAMMFFAEISYPVGLPSPHHSSTHFSQNYTFLRILTSLLMSLEI